MIWREEPDSDVKKRKRVETSLREEGGVDDAKMILQTKLAEEEELRG